MTLFMATPTAMVRWCAFDVVFLLLATQSLAFFHAPHRRPSCRRAVTTTSMIAGELKSEMERAVAAATGAPFEIVSRGGGFGGGGGGASVGTISNGKTEYFYKLARGGTGYDMLSAEYNGVLDMYNTRTIRVPKPVAFGSVDFDAFVVFEKLAMGGGGTGERMGRELAQMHRHTSPNGMFGWRMNNTIGATFQPNTWTADWPTFWDEQRLGHMLALCKHDGAVFPNERALRDKVGPDAVFVPSPVFNCPHLPRRRGRSRPCCRSTRWCRAWCTATFGAATRPQLNRATRSFSTRPRTTATVR
jgi:hypothetical protein